MNELTEAIQKEEDAKIFKHIRELAGKKDNTMEKITNEELILELRRLAAKTIGTQNLLKQGKEWYAIGKLDGIYSKILILLNKLGASK